jgi:hypothetical protein
LQVNEIDGPLDFVVDPSSPAKFENNLWIYEFDHIVGKKTQIKVILKNIQGTQSHLIIKQITLNDLVLNNLDLWSKYIVYGNDQPMSTFGYMNQPGYYVLNIHQNPIIHNYMTYFLSRCKHSLVDQ